MLCFARERSCGPSLTTSIKKWYLVKDMQSCLLPRSVQLPQCCPHCLAPPRFQRRIKNETPNCIKITFLDPAGPWTALPPPKGEPFPFLLGSPDVERRFPTLLCALAAQNGRAGGAFRKMALAPLTKVTLGSRLGGAQAVGEGRKEKGKKSPPPSSARSQHRAFGRKESQPAL